MKTWKRKAERSVLREVARLSAFAPVVKRSNTSSNRAGRQALSVDPKRKQLNSRALFVIAFQSDGFHGQRVSAPIRRFSNFQLYMRLIV
jgi:hypothetical protein